MRVKLILPASAEALAEGRTSLKYSLFPPLGLATLAGYLSDEDEVTIVDEHVEPLRLDDDPELVAMEVYTTSAYRAYEIAAAYRARGVYVVMGGLHVTAVPGEAAMHADTICTGPGEDIWPIFLADFRAGRPARVYESRVRTLEGAPPPRRDLIKRRLYLAPNSLVVSRGCPHSCSFCYKDSFYSGGKSFYTQSVDAALAEIDRLPGRHLMFLDDNLFADRRFAGALFDGLQGMGRVWQAAGTVAAVLDGDLIERAARSGLRSLFVGFETLNDANLRDQGKPHNLGRDYGAAVKRLQSLGVMVNGSFVFGMDADDADSARRTTEWAVDVGIETATFHVLTPYPGTALHKRLLAEGRIMSLDWDRYDTRHAVYEPARMSAEELERGYLDAYREFYRWGSILRGARTKERLAWRARHLAFAGAWKKMEPAWAFLVRLRRMDRLQSMFEGVLSGGQRKPSAPIASVDDDGLSGMAAAVIGEEKSRAGAR